MDDQGAQVAGSKRKPKILLSILFFIATGLFAFQSSVQAEVEITVHSIPEPANLKINGVARGTTPVKLVLVNNTILKIQIEADTFNGLEYDFTATKSDTLYFDLKTSSLTTEEVYQSYIAAQVINVIPLQTPPEVLPAESPQPEVLKTDTPATDVVVPDCIDKTSVDKKPQILQEPKAGSIPVEIQNLKLKGKSKYKIHIGLDGLPKEIQVVESSGNEILDQWIISKLEKTEWETASKADSPVACWRVLTVQFDTVACRLDFPDLYE